MEGFKTRLGKRTTIVQKVMQLYAEQEMSVYSGYAALYILMSLVPLLMLVLTVVNRLPWFSVQDLADALFRILPDIPDLRDLVTGVLNNLNRQSGNFVALASAAAMLWSVYKAVSAIRTGLEQVQQRKSKILEGIPVVLLFTFVYILVIPSLLAFRLMGSALKQSIMTFLNLIGLHYIAAFLSVALRSAELFIAAMVVLLWLTYTFLPAGKRPLLDQIPGAVFASLGWILSTAGFAWFIPRFWKASVIYGSLAAILLCIMWVRILVMILFIGAALNEAITMIREERDEGSREAETGSEIPE